MKVKVQRPPAGIFTRDELTWDENWTAHIQAGRFLDFVLGESNRIFPQTVFLVDETWRDNSNGNAQGISEDAHYSEKRSYRCAYGPEDRLHTEKPSQCDRIVKLGCQCRFEYRKLRNDPDVVCIKFEAKRHITRDGRGAHGAWDGGFRDAARAAPKISADIKSWIFSRLQLRLSPVEILAEHRENVLSRMQKEGMGYHTCQDDFLKLLHIQRVVSSVMKGTWKDPVVLRQRARVKQARLRKVMRDWRPTFTFFYPSFQTWTPRKRRRVLQCTDPNTISERRSGAQEDPLELSSSSDEEAEAEAQVAPTDVIPEVSSEPTDLDACLAKGAQAGQNYYASMFLHVKEALKIAETDLANKSSQSNSVLRFPATKRTTLY